MERLLDRTIRMHARSISQWNGVNVSDFLSKVLYALPSLDLLIDTQRAAFNKAIQPFARNLHILSFPTELLVIIFAHFSPRRNYCKLASPYQARRDVESIKNVRLTCVKFCDASDQFLLDCVDVAIMYTSLTRLNQISLHPTISKSIRTIRIDVRFYSRLLASDETEYIRFAREQLLQSIISLQRLALSLQNQNQGALKEEVLAMIQRGGKIYELWGSYIATQKVPSKNLKANAAIQAITSGHEEYRRHYSHQDWTLQNGFAQAVAEAVRRMPQAVSLLLWDRDNSNCLIKSFGTNLDVRQALSEVGHRPLHWLIKPMTWDIINRRPREKLPTDLLWQIPIELYRARVQLVQLGISLDPGYGFPSTDIYDAWDLNDETIAELNAAAKYLERFEYQGPSEQPRNKHSNLMKYMCAMISGPWLKNFEVSFLLYAVRHNQSIVRSSIPIGSLLSSFTAPDLVCKVHGGFFRNIEDIEATIHDCPPHLVLERPDLCEGDWAEALDILRSRPWAHFELLDPFGGESDDLDNEKFYDIFGLQEGESSAELNKASLYVCHDERQTLNPLRFVLDELDEPDTDS